MSNFKCGHEAAGYNALKYTNKKKTGTRCRICYNKARQKVASKRREQSNDHAVTFRREDGSTFKADGYKLRMVFLEWWLYLYYGEEDTGQCFGPYTYNQALRRAEKHELTDVERGK